MCETQLNDNCNINKKIQEPAITVILSAYSYKFKMYSKRKDLEAFIVQKINLINQQDTVTLFMIYPFQLFKVILPPI